MEDFFPWVHPISNHPPTSENEEDEDKKADLVHNFSARKRKRDARFKWVTDATPKVVDEVS